MRIPLKWLAEYVNVTLPPAEMGQRLTLAGLECAAIESFPPGRSGWDSIFVARVVEVAPHPNADRLRLATVEFGSERHTVVCGAPNVAAGQRVAFARVGARLIDGHSGQPTVLKAARIRGVESAGMVCSEKELGLSEEHEGILALPEDAPVGMPLADYLGDTVLDLEITANRPDCLSLLGVAREVGALTGQEVREPPAGYPEGPEPVERLASVAIEAPGLCPRYCAAVLTGVRVGPSPAWLQERLKAVGMRPINNVVDVTNYVMLEYGEPLHAFDLERLRDHRIIVRRARPGEALVTLDGARRPLAPEMLVIADSRAPVALAGVMGGAQSEVTEATTGLLLEAAAFNRASIRRTSRALALRSEASLRFEKGLSPELPAHAIRRACRLLQELCGGIVARGIIDVYPGGGKGGTALRLERRQIARILGTALPDEQVERTLRGLGFVLTPIPSSPQEGEDKGGGVTSTDGWDVAVPYWRTDISSYFDLAEELARVVGYDAAPTATLSGALPSYVPQPTLELKERVRDVLAASGLQEVITYSLVSRALLERGGSFPAAEDKVEGPPLTLSLSKGRPQPGSAAAPSPSSGEGALPPVRVHNPMSSEQEYLRTSLRPSILAAIAANEDRGERGQALFEVGRRYLPRPRDLPEEREAVVAAFAGPWRSTAGGWLEKERAADFYDAKGALEALLASLGVVASFEPISGGSAVIPSAAGAPSPPPPEGEPAPSPAEAGRGERSRSLARPEPVAGRAALAADPLLVPGRGARISVGGAAVGVVGEVRPEVLHAFDISASTVALFEIDLEALLPLVKESASARRSYTPISRYPPVARDLAVLVDRGTPSARIEAVIRGQPLVASVSPFDVYEGEGLPPGRASLAYHIVYQSRDRTLTDEEVERAQSSILRRLERELGAALRG